MEIIKICLDKTNVRFAGFDHSVKIKFSLSDDDFAHSVFFNNGFIHTIEVLLVEDITVSNTIRPNDEYKYETILQSFNWLIRQDKQEFKESEYRLRELLNSPKSSMANLVNLARIFVDMKKENGDYNLLLEIKTRDARWLKENR